MPFMVIYRTSDGTSTYEQLEAIDEAAMFVERLRNNEGVDQIRIYRMEEISFAFRPYYKVELGLPDKQQHPAPPRDVVGIPMRAEPEPATDDDGPAAVDDAGAPEATTVVEVEPEAPAPSSTTAMDLGPNGARRGLFGR
jgi:hypothetical protein